MSAPRAALLALVALLAPALAAAQDSAAPAPAGATPLPGLPPTTADIYAWIGDENEAVSSWNETNGTLFLALAPPNATTNATTRTYYLNLSGDLVVANASLIEVVGGTNWTTVRVPYTENASTAEMLVTIGYAVFEGNETASRRLYAAQAPLSITVPAPPAEDDRIPTGVWIGAGVVLLAAVALGGVAAKRRADRRRMNEGPRRSQVMREMELEQKLEKAKQKDPEQAAVIQQEIRQQEQVREKRRELQILEAKRVDALKTIDLLRKRHEAGGLTKLQYDNMVAKKQQDLQRIEAEIAQMEAEDGTRAAGA